MVRIESHSHTCRVSWTEAEPGEDRGILKRHNWSKTAQMRVHAQSQTIEYYCGVIARLEWKQELCCGELCNEWPKSFRSEALLARWLVNTSCNQHKHQPSGSSSDLCKPMVREVGSHDWVVEQQKMWGWLVNQYMQCSCSWLLTRQITWYMELCSDWIWIYLTNYVPHRQAPMNMLWSRSSRCGCTDVSNAACEDPQERWYATDIIFSLEDKNN